MTDTKIMNYFILIFICGWVAAITGVALGGFLVFKTKRDPYEPLFTKNGKGEAFNIDDDLGTGPDNPVLPKELLKRNKAFQEQFDAEKFARDIGERAATR